MAIVNFAFCRNRVSSVQNRKESVQRFCGILKHPTPPGKGPCLQAVLSASVVYCFLGKKYLSVVLYSL